MRRLIRSRLSFLFTLITPGEVSLYLGRESEEKPRGCLFYGGCNYFRSINVINIETD